MRKCDIPRSLEKISPCTAMVQQVVRYLISGLLGSIRANVIILGQHLIIKDVKVPLRLHFLIPHLTNIMQNTAGPKKHGQVLKLDFSPLLQARPPPFEPGESVLSNALNLPNLLIKRVLRPSKILMSVRNQNTLHQRVSRVSHHPHVLQISHSGSLIQRAFLQHLIV